MVDISCAHSSASVVGLEEVPAEKISSYGIVGGEQLEQDGVFKLNTLIEKPAIADAPSNLAVAGRYLLHPRIFELLENTHAGHGGEIQLTDAIAALLKESPVLGYRYPGRRFDIGNPAGYLETLNGYSSKVREF
jgi:UTP--glucose-1-phosphate uridylyltransferase